MRMLMMNVRKMRVSMQHRLVSVLMNMGLARLQTGRVFVLMMSVV